MCSYCMQFGGAQTYYREAMTLWDEYKEQGVECDRLQRIHAMENLAAVLSGSLVVEEGGDDSNSSSDEHECAFCRHDSLGLLGSFEYDSSNSGWSSDDDSPPDPGWLHHLQVPVLSSDDEFFSDDFDDPLPPDILKAFYGES